MLIDDQCLNLQLLRLKDGCGLASGHAVYARRSSRSQKNIAVRSDGGGPDGARRGGCHKFESRRKQQESVARHRDAVGSPLGEIVVLILFPGTSTFSRNQESSQYKGREQEAKKRETDSIVH